MPHQQADDVRSGDIAIIGLAGRFPGARTIEQFWSNIQNGVESITVFSEEELLAEGVDPSTLKNPNYVRARGSLEGCDLFDAGFFGFTPRDAEVLDPQHRLLLECAWEALEHAGCDPDRYDGLVGVFAGAATSAYLVNVLTNPAVMASVGGMQARVGNDKDYLAARVSYKLNLHGPSLTVQTACSTSLVAVQLACQSLQAYQCDVALAGGVAVTGSQRAGYMYHVGGVASPDGHCRAFDAQARGTVGGAGVGLVVLKRLTDALHDRDSIHAVIRGAAINNDGTDKVGFTAPSVEGQAAVIASAHAMAEVEPDTIDYIEAHGTGTSVGDPIEIAALTKAFRLGTDQRSYCAIGSVKTNVGHLDAAAGVTGLIKTVLALKHRMLPPSLHFVAPNPKIDFASSPFYVNTTARPWIANGGPRRAGVSSFGIGGTNAHVVVEEAPAVACTPGERPWQVLTLSAKTETALEAATERLSAHLTARPDIDLADAAYTLHVGRRELDHRRILVCRADGAWPGREGLDPRGVIAGLRRIDRPNVAFMFSGQAAQYAGMAADLYRTEPVFREQLDTCAALLDGRLDYDLTTLLQGGDAKSGELSRAFGQTAFVQPALFAVEYALAKLWMEWGVRPSAMIGHSIGEYVAACLAGVFSLEDALRLVAIRGQLMQALPEGAMLSVSIGEQELRQLLPPGLSIAAVNAPSLCVVSGPPALVEDFERSLERDGRPGRRLHVARAFHSEMVEPILAAFDRHLRGVRFNAPKTPFVSTVSGTWIKEREAADPSYWVRHLRQTVRFGDGVRTLLEDADRVLLEVGPGNTLASLARQQQAARDRLVVASLPHPQEARSDSAHLLTTLGRLWTCGVDIDWRAFHARETRSIVDLPTYPFERQRYWIDARKDARTSGAAASRGHLGAKASVDRWLYAPTWKRSIAPAGPRIEADRWLLFFDRGGLGEAIARRLEALGHTTIAVRRGAEFAQDDSSSFTIRPGSAEDYEALLAALNVRGGIPSRIVHLWNADASTPASSVTGTDDHDDVFARAQDDGFHSLVCLTRAAAARRLAGQLSLSIVSTGLHDVLGEEVLTPEKATVLGPCKVLPQEYPGLVCRNIDVAGEPGARLVQQLVAELTTPASDTGASDTIVAYRGAHRWIQEYAPIAPGAAASAPAVPLQQGGVYLITGGSGRIGLVLAEYLAKEWRAKLVLVSRTGLLADEKRDEWEAAGAEIMVVRADVADQDQMRAVVEQIDQRFGALHGVIHAAGHTGKQTLSLLQETSRADADAHFRPKIAGLRVLDAVLAGRRVDFLIAMSSLSSVLGGLRFGAYAAANHFMDAFVQHRRREHSHREQCHGWTSVNWDGWSLDGPSGAGITPGEGVVALQRILALEGSPQVVVSTRDLSARLDQWVGPGLRRHIEAAPVAGSESAAASASSGAPRPALRQAFAPPTTDVERKIARAWADVLGVQEVGIHDDFFELGGHSLAGIHLTARLRTELDADGLQLNDLFQAPTVAMLAAVVQKTQKKQEPRRASHDALVAIQPEGTRRPFFCVHPIGGHVFRFVSLARHLGTNRPFYGLQARGLAEVAESGEHHESVADMAAEYLKAIREVQPEGPYLIGGWSFGGFVAFEMALQLRAHGDDVGLLAIVDAHSPRNFRKLSAIDDATLLIELARQRARKQGKTLQLFRADLEAVPAREQFAFVLDRLRETDLVPSDIAEAWLQHYVKGYRMREMAARDYSPPIYDGPVTIFRARDTDPEVLSILQAQGVDLQDPSFGWSQLSSVPIQVHIVPGYHETIVLEPNVQVLAERLNTALQEAEALQAV